MKDEKSQERKECCQRNGTSRGKKIAQTKHFVMDRGDKRADKELCQRVKADFKHSLKPFVPDVILFLHAIFASILGRNRQGYRFRGKQSEQGPIPACLGQEIWSCAGPWIEPPCHLAALAPFLFGSSCTWAKLSQSGGVHLARARVLAGWNPH